MFLMSLLFPQIKNINIINICSILGAFHIFKNGSNILHLFPKIIWLNVIYFSTALRQRHDTHTIHTTHTPYTPHTHHTHHTHTIHTPHTHTHTTPHTHHTHTTPQRHHKHTTPQTHHTTNHKPQTTPHTHIHTHTEYKNVELNNCKLLIQLTNTISHIW